MENKYKNAKKKNVKTDNFGKPRSRVLSLAQLLSRVRKKRGNNSSTTSIQSTSANQMTNLVSAQKDTLLRVNNSSEINDASLVSTGTRAESKTFVQGAFGKVGQNQKGQRNGQLVKQNSNLQRDRYGSSSGMSKNQTRFDYQKGLNSLKPIIRPKNLLLILLDEEEVPVVYRYNPRIIDFKNCRLLQRYIGLGGKILPRRQTRLSAKQQRHIAKAIKTARVMGLLPFVSKENPYFR